MWTNVHPVTLVAPSEAFNPLAPGNLRTPAFAHGQYAISDRASTELPPTGLMLREILRVTFQQRGHIRWHQVDLAPDFFALARRKPAEAEIRVQTASHSLE